MGCRTWAFWIIPTLRLFVWRANAKLHSRAKKKEREREMEKLLWRRRDPFCEVVQANSSSWLEALTGSHPVWVSGKSWGGCVWLQWANKCRFQRHFLGVPLAETSPHLEVNVSYLLPKKTEKFEKKKKKKKTSKKPRRTKRETHWKDLICFEWVTNVRASWGGVHKGFCAIWIVWQGPWNRYKGNPRSPWAFQALMEAGTEVSKASCTLRLGASWGVCSSPPPMMMMMGQAAA